MFFFSIGLEVLEAEVLGVCPAGRGALLPRQLVLATALDSIHVAPRFSFALHALVSLEMP